MFWDHMIAFHPCYSQIVYLIISREKQTNKKLPLSKRRGEEEERRKTDKKKGP